MRTQGNLNLKIVSVSWIMWAGFCRCRELLLGPMQINASNYIRDLVQLLYYIQPAYFLWGCLDYKTCGGKDSTRMSSVLWFKERERVCGEVVFAWVMCVRWLTKYNGVHCLCMCLCWFWVGFLFHCTVWEAYENTGMCTEHTVIQVWWVSLDEMVAWWCNALVCIDIIKSSQVEL